jgi:hypothetical protein
MADVFGREDSPFAGAFAADKSILQLGDMGSNAAGSLVQNLNVNYQQAVNQVFEIGSNNRYYVVGRTSGTIGFGRIVGPKIVALELLQRLGNVCQGDAASHRLQFILGSSACNWKDSGGAAAKNVTITADAVVATSVGYTVAAQDMLINENVQCLCGQVSRKN